MDDSKNILARGAQDFMRVLVWMMCAALHAARSLVVERVVGLKMSSSEDNDVVEDNGDTQCNKEKQEVHLEKEMRKRGRAVNLSMSTRPAWSTKRTYNKHNDESRTFWRKGLRELLLLLLLLFFCLLFLFFHFTVSHFIVLNIQSFLCKFAQDKFSLCLQHFYFNIMY